VDGHGALNGQQGIVLVREGLQAEHDDHGGSFVVHCELSYHALGLKGSRVRFWGLGFWVKGLKG
jgi:hypothetical protein